jgi:hypothetical protein
MISEAKEVKTMIRILDDYAIVPSSDGRDCYHVAIEDGLSVHCTCPDHARRSRVCKHMTAVDSALRGEAARVRRDCYEVTRTPKPASRKTTTGGTVAKVEAEVAQLAQGARRGVRDADQPRGLGACAS